MSGLQRAEFMKDLMPDYLERFPLEDYPYVSSRKVREDPQKGMTEAAVKAMSNKNRKAYLKRVKRFNRNTDEELRDSIKTWFHNKVRRNNDKTHNPFEAPLQAVKKHKGKAPQRPGLPQFVAGNDLFEDEVLALSMETGDSDRLPSRVVAASELIAGWNEEEMQKAKDMLEEDYQKKCSEYSSVMIPKDSKELDLEDELQKTK
ncbi:hypothetical protein V5O48_019246 [Marasmius crinis-equi]|uniref:Uncharacterized protein n=1 Tax=Marasmius crinis-equi TaxID=585013 RepID=A0ABR3EIX1_9AGAR